MNLLFGGIEAGGTKFCCAVGDNSGNVYMTGLFSSTSITLGNITLTNTGGIDVFILKYDASGNVLWAKSAGGVSDDNLNSVKVDASGNIYLGGYFYSPALDFGTIQRRQGCPVCLSSPGPVPCRAS